MLRKLYINHMFRHNDVTFEFQKGLTGIIGPNESGKSLITEAVRYALFGSQALRGTSEDYKKLHVELDFTVSDVDYHVTRKGSRAELTGGVQATATKPVNEALIRILGYNLTVFDVANACNQGQVEALSDMRPAERKAMVDQTVGLDVLDGIIKFCGDEGNALKREAQGLERTLIAPVAPEVPEDIMDVADAEAELAEAEFLSNEYLQLKGALSSAPVKPKKPKACKVKDPIEVLEAILERRKTLISSIANTQRLQKELDLPFTSIAEINGYEEQHAAYDLWVSKKKLLDQGNLECPDCGHSWPVAEGLDQYADVVEVSPPSMTRAAIATQRGLHENYAKLESFRTRAAAYEEELAETTDRSEDLKVRRDWEQEQLTYESQLVAYKTYSEGLEEKQAQFELLEGWPEVKQSLTQVLAISRGYAKDKAVFDKQQRVYEENRQVHEDLVYRAECFLQSRKAVGDLKLRIKTHLLPSLNSVASLLLNRMTGGERSLVQIDTDFEILIDDQRLHTLSGSGKAVANLAVRLALGQILTNRVFSVFMADEIDASMDEERAAYTAEALRRLTNQVAQVIQVTHKRPETDHTIELNK